MDLGVLLIGLLFGYYLYQYLRRRGRESLEEEKGGRGSKEESECREAAKELGYGVFDCIGGIVVGAAYVVYSLRSLYREALKKFEEEGKS